MPISSVPVILYYILTHVVIHCQPAALQVLILPYKSLGIFGGFPSLSLLMATILDSLVGSCVKKLQHIITEKAVLVLGVQEDLKELERTMDQIK